MKLCFIADATSVHTKRWCEYFSKEGHEVHLITYEPPGEPMAGVYLHVVGSMFKSLYLAFPFRHLRIMRIVKMIEPDIVHAHFITKFGFHGALLGFHPLVMSAWGSDVLVIPYWSKVLFYFTKFSLREADLITCDGDNAIDGMVKMGIGVEKIYKIQHGVDTNKFNPSYKNDVFRDKFNIFDSPIVISTRNLKHIYDVESLIHAIPLVLDECPNTKFIIMGDGEQKPCLIELVKSLNVYNSVIFVGYVLHDDLPLYLASSDVYISTSLSDGGIALSTQEAMSCGLTPVVTDVGDNQNWIKNGENGFVISIKNPKALAQNIIFILNNPKFKENASKYNRKLIEEKADYYKEMEKMDDLYNGLIKRCKI